VNDLNFMKYGKNRVYLKMLSALADLVQQRLICNSGGSR